MAQRCPPTAPLTGSPTSNAFQAFRFAGASPGRRAPARKRKPPEDDAAIDPQPQTSPSQAAGGHSAAGVLPLLTAPRFEPRRAPQDIALPDPAATAAGGLDAIARRTRRRVAADVAGEAGGALGAPPICIDKAGDSRAATPAVPFAAGTGGSGGGFASSPLPPVTPGAGAPGSSGSASSNGGSGGGGSGGGSSDGGGSSGNGEGSGEGGGTAAVAAESSQLVEEGAATLAAKQLCSQTRSGGGGGGGAAATAAGPAAPCPATPQTGRSSRPALLAPATSGPSRPGKRKSKAAPPSRTAASPSAALPPPRGVPEKLGDAPLRLVIVGHNPSEHAWRSGHYYSNPSNHLWRILIATGIAPPGTRGAEDDDKLPGGAGVGFLDVGCGHPGTDSSAFSSEVFEAWSRAFYARLRAHMARAAASMGCVCGRCGAPRLVAFTGKRQFLELLNVGRPAKGRVKTVEFGPQSVLPPGWPLPPSSEVWVCSSTSGAAAMTREQREGPYKRLAERLAREEWPRRGSPACAPSGPAAAAPAAGGAPVCAPTGPAVESGVGDEGRGAGTGGVGRVEGKGVAAAWEVGEGDGAEAGGPEVAG